MSDSERTPESYMKQAEKDYPSYVLDFVPGSTFAVLPYRHYAVVIVPGFIPVKTKALSLRRKYFRQMCYRTNQDLCPHSHQEWLGEVVPCQVAGCDVNNNVHRGCGSRKTVKVCADCNKYLY